MQQEIMANGLRRSQILEALNPKVQELIILPTEQCNFRCTYCYEDFIVGKMPDGVREGLKRLIATRVPEIGCLRFSWFGGEPLAAKDVVLDISRFAYAKCQEYGVKFEGGLTTNGYLLDLNLFEELVSLNQKNYQISLDGDKDAHDTTRLRADGKGTFDRIWKNLLTLRQSEQDFEIVLRLHVTDLNLESLRSLCRKIHENFSGDSRFVPHFHDVRNLGGEGGQTVKAMRIADYNRQVEILSRILALGISGEEAAEAVSDGEDAGSGGAKRGKMKVTAAPMYGSESSAMVLFDRDMEADDSPGQVAAVHESAEHLGSAADGATSMDESEVRETEVPGKPYICYASKPNSLLIRADGRVGKCTVALSDTRNDIGTIREDGTIELDHKKLGPWIRGMESLSLDDLGCPLTTMPLHGLRVL